jgi:fluoride exporter
VPLLGFVSVGVGAALGAWLRWGLGIALNSVLPTLALGTLAANLIGGYLMGLAIGYFEHVQGVAPEMRLFITTGFLGGLTTFSAFSGDTTALLLRAEYLWAALGIGAHVIGSLLMTLLGVGTILLARGWMASH